MNRTLYIILCCTLTVIMISCKHAPLMTNDNSDVIPGNDSATAVTCNPDTVYFNNTILPLFISNCAKGGCHDAVSAQEGIVLNSYSNIMNTGGIQPFNPNAGHIVDVISSTDPDDRMPPPPNQLLTSQQITQIVQWINQGAQNNYCDECDTLNVKYSGKVRTILDGECLGCHNNSLISGGVNLSDYAGVQAVAANGSLYGSITHAAGYVAMPQGGNQLQQCEIDAIRIWINAGAQNN